MADAEADVVPAERLAGGAAEGGAIRAGHAFARQPRGEPAAGELDAPRAPHPEAEPPLLRVEQHGERFRIGRER